MRVLLDECMPRKLWRDLIGHEVYTVTQEGWSGKRNGELLALMNQKGIEVLVTADQNLVHQQNLAAFGVSVIVMIAVRNKPAMLRPLIPDVLNALTTIKPGDFVEIRSP